MSTLFGEGGDRIYGKIRCGARGDNQPTNPLPDWLMPGDGTNLEGGQFAQFEHVPLLNDTTRVCRDRQRGVRDESDRGHAESGQYKTEQPLKQDDYNPLENKRTNTD